MNFNAMLRSLYLYGERLGSPTTELLEAKDLYCFETTDPEAVPGLSLRPITVPCRVGRSGMAVKSNVLYDNLKYLCGSEYPKQREGFWTRAREIVEEIGDAELAKAVRLAEITTGRWRLQRIATVNGNEHYRVHLGGKAPEDLNLSSLTGAPKGTMADASLIVLLYHGKPITELPAFQRWWEEDARENLARKNVGREPTDIDVITGKPCFPARLHPAIRFRVGGNTSFISFDKESFRYDGQIQGSNFPMAERTAWLYASAIRSLLNPENGAFVSTGMVPRGIGVKPVTEYQAIFWPEQGVVGDFPLIRDITTVLGGRLERDEAVQLWARLEEAAKVSDASADVLVNVAHIKSGSYRAATLEYRRAKLSALVRNLLQFRWEMSRPLVGRKSSFLFRQAIKEPGSKLLFPERLASQMAWSVLFGLALPGPVEWYLLDGEFSDRKHAWTASYLTRNKGISDMHKLPERKTHLYIDKEGKKHEVLLTLPGEEEFFLESLSKSEAHVYGRMIAEYVAIKRCHHSRKAEREKTVKADVVLKQALSSPRRWRSGDASTKLEMYVRVAATRSFYERRVTQFHERRYREFSSMLSGWNPVVLRSLERAEANQGWGDQIRYHQWHSEFNRLDNRRLLDILSDNGTIDQLRRNGTLTEKDFREIEDVVGELRRRRAKMKEAEEAPGSPEAK